MAFNRGYSARNQVDVRAPEKVLMFSALNALCTPENQQRVYVKILEAFVEDQNKDSEHRRKMEEDEAAHRRHLECLEAEKRIEMEKVDHLGRVVSQNAGAKSSYSRGPSGASTTFEISNKKSTLGVIVEKMLSSS